MPGSSKKEADAYDRMLEAADSLFDLIESSEIEVKEEELEELSIFLAENGHKIRHILRHIKKDWP